MLFSDIRLFLTIIVTHPNYNSYESNYSSYVSNVNSYEYADLKGVKEWVLRVNGC